MNTENILLSEAEKDRYSRQMVLKEVGVSGQLKLKNSSVLIIGAGGLGSPVSIYLSGAGVGKIGIMDGDTVDLSNLPRQIIYDIEDIGKSKAEMTQQKLSKRNPEIEIKSYFGYLESGNAESIISEYDVVVVATDNYDARYLVSDTCVKLRKPFVDASVLMFEGQITTYVPDGGCYRCLYPEAPKNKEIASISEAGILGTVAGLMGVLQATEVIKILLNIGDLYSTRLTFFEALTGKFRTLNRKKNEKCLTCGTIHKE